MILTGTFIDEITYDIPSSNWSREQWKQEFANMKKSGIDTVIFIRGGFEDKCIFPSETLGLKYVPDFADFVFRTAAEHSINVYFGLYISNICWNDGDYITEININKKFVKEVLNRYNQYPNFKGFYVPHESDRDDGKNNLTSIIGGLASVCKDAAPDKKVLVSPFFHSRLMDREAFFTPERHYEEWDKIFEECRDVDICAFQDGTSPIGEMDAYFGVTKQLCDKYNIEHWVNVETFERDVRCMYYPISFEVLKRKVELHNGYADKLITFEYSHFLSPQSIYPSAGNLYKRYMKHFLPEVQL